MREHFFRALQARLVPVLRAEGFARKEWRFRRRRGVVWDCVEIQRSTSQEHCYVDLGVTFSFLPRGLGGGTFDKLTCAGCPFFARVKRRGTEVFHYGKTNADSEKSVEELVRSYEKQGPKWFVDQAELPGSFGDDDPEDFGPRDAMVRAFIFEHCGDTRRAARFARHAATDSYFAKSAQKFLQSIG